MTVRQLMERLGRHNGDLEACVRCQWQGPTPASNLFAPRIVIEETDPDTAVEQLVIECDQDEESE